MSSKRTAKSASTPKTVKRTQRRPAPRAKGPAPRTGVDGVNVNDLVLLTEDLKNHPAKADFTFKSTTHWMGGAHTRTKIQAFHENGHATHTRKAAFHVEADEPAILLGSDRGPSPMEYALAGIGSSLAAGLAYNAAARGIQLQGVEVECEGGIDFRGTLGVTESGKSGSNHKEVRPGFENIRIVCHIKSDAPPAELKELLDYTKDTNPLVDMLRHPVPIALELKH